MGSVGGVYRVLGRGNEYCTYEWLFMLDYMRVSGILEMHLHFFIDIPYLVKIQGTSNFPQHLSLFHLSSQSHPYHPTTQPPSPLP